MSVTQTEASASFDQLNVFEASLADRYAALREGRDGHPVYGIEHGLDNDEIDLLRIALSEVLRTKGRWAITLCPLPLIAYASEIGYAYEGMLSGFWPQIEARLQVAFDPDDREAMSAAFGNAHRKFALAEPDATVFSRHFRHIAWPLTNALAPRQIHAGVAEILINALAYGRADDAGFAQGLRRAALRTDSDRLVDWSVNEQRLVIVARALLGAPDMPLSTEIVERLGVDATTKPLDRKNVRSARQAYAASQNQQTVPARLMLQASGSGYGLGVTRWLGRDGRGAEPWAAGFDSIDAVRDWARENRARLSEFNESSTFKILFIRDRASVVETFIELCRDDPVVISDAADFLMLCDRGTQERYGFSMIGDVAGLACCAVPQAEADLRVLLSEAGLHIVDPGIEVEGGLPLDFAGRYATGVPLTVRVANAAGESVLEATVADHLSRQCKLGSEDRAILFPAATASVHIRARTPAGELPERELTFIAPDPPDPLIALAADPIKPGISDLIAGRLSVRLSSPIPLRAVPLTVCVQRQGASDVWFEVTIPVVPTRLTFQAGPLQAVGEWIETLDPRPRSMLVTLDIGVDRLMIPVVEPDPVILWSLPAEGWEASFASDTGEGPSETLSLKYVVADHPCAIITDMPDPEATVLLLPEGVSPVHGFVTGPPRSKSLGRADPLPPIPHRNFSIAETAASRSLEAEVLAYVGWSCAGVETPIAAFDARRAAMAAERSIVSTLCGSSWIDLEQAARIEPFIDTFMRHVQAAPSDPFALAEREDDLMPLDDAGRTALIKALRAAFLADPDLSLTSSRGPFNDDDGEVLDDHVACVWKAINATRLSAESGIFDPEIFNETTEWNHLLDCAQASAHLSALNRMIAPAKLGRVLLGLNYDAIDTGEIAAAIAAHRVDLGLLAGSSRSLLADDIKTALLLWMQPRGFVASEWRPLMARLLEDRMTARAMRYAVLRLRAATELAA